MRLLAAAFWLASPPARINTYTRVPPPSVVPPDETAPQHIGTDDASWWARLNTFDDDAPAAAPPPRQTPVGNRRRLHDRDDATYSVSQFSPGGGDAPWSAADGAYAPEEAPGDRGERPEAEAPEPKRRRTLYDDLECRRDAPSEELRRRYKEACRRCHPDAGRGGDSDRFSAVTRAWAILGDAGKRAEYDDELRRR